MPRVLQLEATTTGGGGVLCQLTCPAITIVAGMALEIIEQIDTATPQAVGDHHDYSITVRSIALADSTVTPVDQNGFGQIGQTAAPRSTDQYPWIRGRWYGRVMSLDAYIGQTVRSVELIARGNLAGTYKHRFAQVAVTKYRNPVYWFYKDGMALPDVSTLAATAPTTVARMCLLDMHEHFPLICTTATSPDSMIDQIKSDRASSGTGRRWVEWNKRKDEFPLEYLSMIELERQGLLAFYDVYRGGDDWFFWQHRANYPDQRVVFASPPDIKPLKYDGANIRYRALVKLAEV